MAARQNYQQQQQQQPQQQNYNQQQQQFQQQQYQQQTYLQPLQPYSNNTLPSHLQSNDTQLKGYLQQQQYLPNQQQQQQFPQHQQKQQLISLQTQHQDQQQHLLEQQQQHLLEQQQHISQQNQPFTQAHHSSHQSQHSQPQQTPLNQLHQQIDVQQINQQRQPFNQQPHPATLPQQQFNKQLTQTQPLYQQQKLQTQGQNQAYQQHQPQHQTHQQHQQHQQQQTHQQQQLGSLQSHPHTQQQLQGTSQHHAQTTTPPTSLSSTTQKHAGTSSQGDGGRFQFEDGGCYAGKWENGMAHGFGTCLTGGARKSSASTGEFAGLWQEGFELSGVYQWQDGDTYEGQWLQGKRHGLGREKKGRLVYKGEWSQGVKGRYGCRESTFSGLKYEGTWNDGVKDGYGVETYPDGGTYQGQWMRGVRHGYGIRQSVAYEVALRFHNEANMMAGTSGNNDETRNEIPHDRDRRVEENRGGFVLQARTSIPEDATVKQPKRPGLFDKLGRPAFRRSLTRQRSASDLISPGNRAQSVGPSSRASSAAGSVRSTTSAISQISSVFSTLTSSTRRSSIEEDDELGSFCSDVDLANDQVTEKYAGDWKNDKRSGYGVCERSDGIKYEGEWLNNRKHGYGVTTLSDNTRVEGKYKNNVLVSAGRSSKFFRSSKVRDRVDAAVLLAHKSAGMANQKMEIANVRMTSARMKANQVEEVVRKALADAETARSVAQQYQSTHNQESKIIANRQPSIEINPMKNTMGTAGNFDARTGNIVGNEPTNKQNKFTFFKFKKSQTRSKSETRDPNKPSGFSFFGSQRSSSIRKLTEQQTMDFNTPDFKLPKSSYNPVNSQNNRANITLDINTGIVPSKSPHTASIQPERALQSPVITSNLAPSLSTTFTPHTPDVYRRTFNSPFTKQAASPVHQGLVTAPKNLLNISHTLPNANESYPQIVINSYSSNNDKSLQNDFTDNSGNFSGMGGSRNSEYVTRPSRHSGFKSTEDNYSEKTHINVERENNYAQEPMKSNISRWNDDRQIVTNSPLNNPFHSGPQSNWSQRNAFTDDSHYSRPNQTRSVDHYMETSSRQQQQKSQQFQQQQQQQMQPRQQLQQQKQQQLQQQLLQQQQQHLQQQKHPLSPKDAVLYDNYGRPYPDYNQVSRIEETEDDSLKERRKSLPSIVNNNPTTTSGANSTTSSGGLFSYASSAKPIQPASANVDCYVIENGVRKRLKPMDVATRKEAKTTNDMPHYQLEALKPHYKRGDMGSMPNVCMVKDSEVLPREVVYQMSQQRREELMVQRQEMERREGGSIVVSFEDLFSWLWQRKMLVLVFLLNVAILWAFYNLVKKPKK